MLIPIVENHEYSIYQSDHTGKFFIDTDDNETIVELKLICKEIVTNSNLSIEDYNQNADIVTFNDDFDIVYWFDYVE